jgi:hypothetical protein
MDHSAGLVPLHRGYDSFIETGDRNFGGVSAAHFSAGFLGCEHPVDACACGVALSLPGSDF